MPSSTLAPSGPVAESFRGNTVGARARRMFHATRPKFFPASVLPVVAGTAWGVQAAGSLDLVVALLALLATVCVHAGANVINDVGDESGGTDRENTERIYPYTGGSQFIQQQIIDARGMARLGAALLTLGGLLGVALVVLKGPMVIVFGAIGVLLAVLYSVGPLRLSSLGLGELSVAVAFGVLPIAGAAWLQSGTVDGAVIVYAIPVSMWVAAILLINEVPDLRADGATGKRTLPVRMGLIGTAWLYFALHAIALVATLWSTLAGQLPMLAPLIPLALLVPAVRAVTAIKSGIANREAMTKAIESTLAIHTIGSLWLAGCALFLFWFGG